jgi:ASC-1-like (ASCH) protein
MRDSSEIKKKIINAGYKAVEELIKVAEESIVSNGDDISADKLKNAAASKRLAIFDAFEILNKIELEKENIAVNESGIDKINSRQGFAERKSK